MEHDIYFVGQFWVLPILVDTIISIANSFFKVNRTDISKCGMSASAVVKHFDPAKDFKFGLCSGVESPEMYHFILQAGKE